MEKMIAFCGINCAECPTFIATREDNDEKRKKVAEEWSKAYQASLQPGDINCDGCQTGNGRLFSHCNVCDIRKCGMEKAVSTCAGCDEYACNKLSKIFSLAPQAKAMLDRIRKGLPAG